MRIRSRLITGNVSSDWKEVATRTFDFPVDPIRVNSAGVSTGSVEFEQGTYSSSIEDVVGRGFQNPKGKRKSLPFPIEQSLLSVNPVHHDTTRVVFHPCSVSYRFQGSLGFQGGFVDRNTHSFSSGGAFLAHDCSIFDVENLFSTSESGTASPIPSIDWFHLADAFYEACDSFVPDSFFLGEDIAQSSIFVDALKLVLNPSKSISSFIKAGINLYKKDFRRRSVRDVSRGLVRHASNGSLFYNFAVKPALADISSAISSHRKVSSRMNYLVNHRGKYVPVRVRQKLSGDIDLLQPSPDPNNESTFFCNYTQNTLTATISAMAQVRQDLTYGDTWKAYVEYFGLNKVIGTAWELIPFSFVVDWFTNAQERINSLTRIRTGGPFVEYKCLCASTKLEQDLGLFCNPGFRHNSAGDIMVAPTEAFPVATRRRVVYDRFPSIPSTSGVVDVSTLGSFHSFIAGCLTVQRFLKR